MSYRAMGINITSCILDGLKYTRAKSPQIVHYLRCIYVDKEICSYIIHRSSNEQHIPEFILKLLKFSADNKLIYDYLIRYGDKILLHDKVEHWTSPARITQAIINSYKKDNKYVCDLLIEELLRLGQSEFLAKKLYYLGEYSVLKHVYPKINAPDFYFVLVHELYLDDGADRQSYDLFKTLFPMEHDIDVMIDGMFENFKGTINKYLVKIAYKNIPWDDWRQSKALNMFAKLATEEQFVELFEHIKNTRSQRKKYMIHLIKLCDIYNISISFHKR